MAKMQRQVTNFGPKVRRMQLQGCRVVRQSLGQPPLSLEAVPPVAERFEVPWVNPQRLRVVSDGLAQLPHLPQAESLVVVKVRVVRRIGDGCPEIVTRELVRAHAVVRDASVVEGEGVARVHHQRMRIISDRLVVLTCGAQTQAHKHKEKRRAEQQSAATQ